VKVIYLYKYEVFCLFECLQGRIVFYVYLNSPALPVINKPTIKPNNPKTDPKISTTKILTKSEESAASLIAAVDPVIPTAIPQIKFEIPTVNPAQNNEYPVYKFSFVNKSFEDTLVNFALNTMAMIKP
jgi:hypothetical protein